jgi:DNA ligase-1
MTFARLAQFLARLEKVSSRLAITRILAELLKEVNPGEIDKACYLSLGRLAPAYAGLEFNLAEKLLIRALARATNTPEDKVKQLYKQLGDLGDVAEKLVNSLTRQLVTLKIVKIYEKLNQIARESGEGSVERKISLTANLLQQVDPLSAKYITRIPLGKLRLGFSELTILDALSWLISGDKRHRGEIERAYEVRADIGQIAKSLKVGGLASLASLQPSVGIPIVPALCQRLPTAEEIIHKMGEIAVEPKYDGTRVQIHYRVSVTRNTQHITRDLPFIRIFTRSLESVTHMFPDLAQAVEREVRAEEVILDGEAVGFDPKTGKILPFQETIKRKRKHQVDLFSRRIPLKCFVFDLLVYNGQNFLDQPFFKRRQALTKIIAGQTIILTPQLVAQDVQKLRYFHHQQIDQGLEGVICKKWNSAYDPGRRGFNWVKLKSEADKKGAGLADTLDCVVMGLYRGKGKRTDFGVGAFLAGIRKDGKSDEFLSVSKIGTGLTDEQFKQLKIESEQLTVKSQPENYRVDRNLAPDVWLKPGLVVEIQADNITVSPIHTASYALRFPRLVRFRDDKTADQTTTLAELKKLYQMQGI